jgi:hypothetical protein
VLSDNQWSQTENALQSLIWAPAGSLESIAVSAQDRHGLFGTTDDFSSSAADLESASPKAASTREGNATTNLLESGPFSRARHRNISSSTMHGYENEKVLLVHDFGYSSGYLTLFYVLLFGRRDCNLLRDSYL